MQQAMLRLIVLISPVLAMKTNTQRTAPFDVLEGSNLTGEDAKVLEDIVLKNAQHDLKQAAEVPSPETNDTEGLSGNRTENASATNSTGAMDGLAENLEFFFLKVAQLETVVELQQLEIRSCHEKIGKFEHILGMETAKLSLLELQQKEQQRTQQAQTIFQRVVKKHHHQREKKTFVTPVKTTEGEAHVEPLEPSSLLRERQERSAGRAEQGKHSSKWGFIGDAVNTVKDTVESGTGLVGDALGDAYEAATDKISFVADTVIDTVEKAIDILSRGFSSWGASCKWEEPEIHFGASAGSIKFPGALCHITLMGQRIKLFDSRWSKGFWSAPFTTAMQSVVRMGSELTECVQTGIKIVICLAEKIIYHMPWSSVDVMQRWLERQSGALKSVVTMGSELTSCAQTGPGIVACLAGKIVDVLPLDSLIGRSNPLQSVVKLGSELTTCAQTGPGIVACLAGKIVDVLPLDSLIGRSNPLQSVVKLGSELTSCAQTGPGIVACLAGKIVDVLPLDSLIGRSNPLQSVVKLGSELTECVQTGPKIVICLAEKIIYHMPWSSVDVLQGWLEHQSGALKSVVTMGSELTTCADADAQGLVSCLGNRIIQYVPPLSHLNHMGDILADFLEGFAKVAATVAGQVLKGGSSMIQEAAKSQFPPAGAAPLVHHSGHGQSLLIKTHTQEHKTLSALQTKSEQEDAGFGFKIHKDSGNYQSKLISQFNGYEKDTSSCLAFAPKNKRGQGGQATEDDWQVQNEDDFVALEPWAVPCGNKWMKKNWDKWQGYSFYTGELSIEKCLTVTYKLSLQPVFAFVGGVQIDLMPKPLAEVDTTVCWPTGRPDAQDLSVLRTEIRSSGLLLFRRSLRLSKRYSEPSDFVDENVQKSTASWNQPANPRAAISRTKLLQTSQNETQSKDKESRTVQEDNSALESLEWMEEEDLYLASVNYSRDLGVNLTSEMRGLDAERRLSLSETMAQGVFQLFNFENPGMVNFKLQALLEENNFELNAQMGFGPFTSGEKKIKLVNIVDQFAVVLYALPFVSPESRNKALASLRGFASDDLPPPPPVALKAGMNIAIHNRRFSQYLNIHWDGSAHSSHTRSYEAGFVRPSSSWNSDWERWTVLDATPGYIGLHHQKTNRILCFDGERVYGYVVAASGFKLRWRDCTFKVVTWAGFFGLHNLMTQRLVAVSAHQAAYGSGRIHPDHIPDGWTWTQFRFQVIDPYLRPGASVGFYNPKWGSWMRMQDDFMDNPTFGGRYPPESYGVGDVDWGWETFEVMDAGSGEIALFSRKWRRFVGLQEDGKVIVSERKAQELSADMTWARFQVVPASQGGEVLIALHNRASNRFLHGQGKSGREGIIGYDEMAPQDYPSSWTWSRWQVVEKSPGDTPSSPSLPEAWKFSVR
ncbi:unnamed protein product [Symbiodinium sp. CCMP2592]|nr:unnamed protein product [Symbiodinium sp. CCMP2592]